MTRARISIIVFSIALIGTNVWWAYNALDNGVTLTYLEDSMQHAARGFNQSVAIIPLVANGAGREEIIAAALKASDLDIEPFEKDGYIWVGELGIKFNAAGKLTEVVTE